MKEIVLFENLGYDFIFYSVNASCLKMINLKNFNAICIDKGFYQLLYIDNDEIMLKEFIQINKEYLFENKEEAMKKFNELQEA